MSAIGVSSVQTRSQKNKQCGVSSVGVCDKDGPYLKEWCTFDEKTSKCSFRSFEEIKRVLPDMVDVLDEIAKRDAKWEKVLAYYTHEHDRLEGEKNILETEIAKQRRQQNLETLKHTGDIEKLLQQKIELDAEIAKEEKDFLDAKKKNKEATLAMTTERNNLSDNLGVIRQQIEEKQAERAQIETRIRQLRDTEATDQEDLDQIVNEIVQKRIELSTILGEIQKLKTDLDAAKQEYETVKQNTRSELLNLQNELTRLNLDEEKLKERQQKLTELDANLTQKEQLQKEVDEAIAALNSQKEQVQAQTLIVNAELKKMMDLKKQMGDQGDSGILPPSLSDQLIEELSKKSDQPSDSSQPSQSSLSSYLPIILAAIATLIYCFIINFQFQKQNPDTKAMEWDWERIGIAAGILFGVAIVIAIIQGIYSRSKPQQA